MGGIQKSGAFLIEYSDMCKWILHNTFKEACIALHLLSDDAHLIHTLNEAVALKMPKQLRLLFAVICLHTEVSRPDLLWQQYKDHLSEDFSRTMPAQLAQWHALQDINSIFQQAGQYPSKHSTIIITFDLIPYITLHAT